MSYVLMDFFTLFVLIALPIIFLLMKKIYTGHRDDRLVIVLTAIFSALFLVGIITRLLIGENIVSESIIGIITGPTISLLAWCMCCLRQSK